MDHNNTKYTRNTFRANSFWLFRHNWLSKLKYPYIWTPHVMKCVFQWYHKEHLTLRKCISDSAIHILHAYVWGRIKVEFIYSPYSLTDSSTYQPSVIYSFLWRFRRNPSLWDDAVSSVCLSVRLCVCSRLAFTVGNT